MASYEGAVSLLVAFAVAANSEYIFHGHHAKFATRIMQYRDSTPEGAAGHVKKSSRLKCVIRISFCHAYNISAVMQNITSFTTRPAISSKSRIKCRMSSSITWRYDELGRLYYIMRV